MHSHHAKCRRPASAAQYHRNTPPPDDGTPIHAPRHRTCFTQTLSRADLLVVRYKIHTRRATSSISYTKSRHASRRAHHRLPSRDAARGFPAVGARTMRVHVTVRSGRIWAHIGGSDQYDEHQSSHLSESQSVSPPPPSLPCFALNGQPRQMWSIADDASTWPAARRSCEATLAWTLAHRSACVGAPWRVVHDHQRLQWLGAPANCVSNEWPVP